MKRGFTLLELVIALFLFSTIVALVAMFFVYFFKDYSFSFEEQQEIGQAQQILTQMIREIRKAQIGDNGAWPLITTDNNALTFYADVDGDLRAEQIRYFVDGTNLKRGVIKSTGSPLSYPPQSEVQATLVSSINTTASGIFAYYNGNWPSDQVNNPLVPSQRILNTRYILVTIMIDVAKNFSAAPFQIQSGVTIRSMKDNL